MELLKNSKGKWCAVFSVFLLMFMFTTPISSSTSEGAACTDLKEQHDLETSC
ncbi:hypothetical protein [Bacillus chungangensis]|uniref:Uncharacterized protein n=1 Tax=Bacillus chungangensis TaxID=587633 RepID=A0ABT9WYI5_9BACI|nr:hypothetical protein [Bacillus chungangensis]MDQ0178173.1 hypothetical protein [Bacillus chungangensis]